MKIILPLLFLVLIAAGYFFSLRIPYHFCQEAIHEGIHSPFLKLRKLPDKFYSGQDYQFIRMVGLTTNKEKQWENLHFNDFLIPFPVRHPSFLIAPYIEKEAGEYLFGFEVLNYSYDIINRVVIRKKKPFYIELYHHKIFQLPLFEKMILDKGLEVVWQDIFKKDIFQSGFLETPPFSENLLPGDIPLTEMVYNLFILTVRERFFPVKVETINFWEKGRLGIIEVKDEESQKGEPTQYLQEVIYYLEGNQVYTIELKTKLEDLMAEKYRQRLLENLKFKLSEQDSSIPLYASFQNLKYQEKLTPGGLVYLYTAFSHQKESENFLSQMIRFLERGKNKKVYLDPLYKYGYEHYGTSFSNLLEKLRETEKEKLDRKVKEEEQFKRKSLEDITILDEVEKFESNEEKIKFYLQKGKDEGEGRTDSKSLIID
jgi:hypothetical protein